MLGLTEEKDDVLMKIRLARRGITGADAVTMLKTALLALTEDTLVATQVRDHLGLRVYRSDGDFVGWQELLNQLAEAHRILPNSEFIEATIALFGADAMRLAQLAPALAKK